VSRNALLAACLALLTLVLAACGGEGDGSTTGVSTNASTTSPADRAAPAKPRAATKPTGAEREGRERREAKPSSKKEGGTGGPPAGKEAQGAKEKQKPAPVEEEPEGERAPQQGAADLNSNEASGDSAPPRTSDSNQSKDRKPSSEDGAEAKDANAP
jgi:hypothetical protein